MKKLLNVILAASFIYSGVVAAAAPLISKTPVLTLAGAKYIAAEAVKKAQSENWQVTIVVSDAGGYVKYLERMDNVQLASLETAIEKAETSIMYRRPTKVFQERIKAGEMPLTLVPSMLPFEGGLPIIVDGDVIGAVGVSGVRSDQDAEIAKAGIDAFLKHINK